MLKPLFLSALLFFTPSLLRAEDPVLFFDGRAHGWKIAESELLSSPERGVTFVGYAQNDIRDYNKKSSTNIKFRAYDVTNKKEIVISKDGMREYFILTHHDDKSRGGPELIYLSQKKITRIVPGISHSDGDGGVRGVVEMVNGIQSVGSI